MNERENENIIQVLQHKWNNRIQLVHVLFAFALVIFVCSIATKFFHSLWLYIPLAFLVFFFLNYFLKRNRIDKNDVVSFLNKAYPELQESAQLTVKPYQSLNMLEKLQLQKLKAQLNENITTPPSVNKKIKQSIVAVFVAFLLAALVVIIPFSKQNPVNNKSLVSLSNISKPEVKLPEIKDADITVVPPVYTGKKRRQQEAFNIVAEQDAMIIWNITTNKKANFLELLFNDKSVVKLKPLKKEGTQWMASKQLTKPGFYQLNIDGKLSELYQTEMIRDEPPVINVQSPKPNTFIRLGEARKTGIRVFISDDYGVDSAYIQATTASGSGEAITFQELRIPFSNFRGGGLQYNLEKEIQLTSLHMTAGDELYFYITAKDNRHLEKRSDVYIIRLEDSLQLMSAPALVSPSDVKPELFRSERQIIIETEQLLKERDTVSEQNFKTRSSNLGTDQELLRLRYGKYLGEETETEIGEEHPEKNSNAASDFGNGDKVIDEYSHKHDIAEDADFFDAATKKQLQAMLTEMWKATLQLKTYKPAAALPFAYNALRLLKDLQQKTRAYVAKTGLQTTPLNMDKRLTGDQDKIGEPINKTEVRQNDSSLLMLRKAIGVLEKVKSGEPLQKNDVEALETASVQLSLKAAAGPSHYLAAYEAIRRIRNGSMEKNDVALAGTALQKLIGSVQGATQQTSSSPDAGLSHRYFMNVKTKHD